MWCRQDCCLGQDASLHLNANRSEVIVFSHKKSRPAVNVKVDNTAVPVADSTCFLGVTITSDLIWNNHISNTFAKARQQLGIIHWTFNQANSNTHSHLYCCLVLPTLDYCSLGPPCQVSHKQAWLCSEVSFQDGHETVVCLFYSCCLPIPWTCVPFKNGDGNKRP